MTSEIQPSRRLPPFEAWQKPDKWIDIRTGLAKSNASKLYLETDDRGFVLPTVAIRQLKELLFWSDYDWPFDSNDPETRPDDHHFHYEAEAYTPDNNGGSDIPQRFRELPTMIGRMPRQFHNALHDFTLPPEMPAVYDMDQYLRSYRIAYSAFKRLYETAGETVQSRRQFSSRRTSIEQGRIIPKDTLDSIGQAYMRSDFLKSFESYGQAIDVFKDTEHKNVIANELNTIAIRKPDYVIRALGRVVNRQSINYTSLIISQAA